MAVFLLDVNVLMALAWGDHAQHQAARTWFSTLGADQWATCPMTQCSLVRISSNPRVTTGALRPREAVLLLEKLITHPKHVFWEDSIGLANPLVPHTAMQGHLQVADAYLLGLSLARGGKIATFDAGMSSLARTPGERAAIVWIPTGPSALAPTSPPPPPTP